MNKRKKKKQLTIWWNKQTCCRCNCSAKKHKLYDFGVAEGYICEPCYITTEHYLRNIRK